MFRCAIEIQNPGSYAAGVFDVGLFDAYLLVCNNKT